jgi:hypothetical protein
LIDPHVKLPAIDEPARDTFSSAPASCGFGDLLSKIKGPTASTIPGLHEKRIVAVLELIGNPEARELLENLVELPASSKLGKEARGVVNRGN